MLELFIDPEGDGLYWYKPSDFQIGFRVSQKTQEVKTWSWFQGGRDPSQTNQVRAKGYARTSGGYIIEGAIAWSFLGMSPKEGDKIHLSPAIHDMDQDRSQAKAVWFFRNEREQNRFELGRLVLAKRPLTKKAVS